jgi:signal transduction histidine kinase/DNA-binding response OmpR family regulator/ligand-binding sensor domain-containing protein
VSTHFPSRGCILPLLTVCLLLGPGPLFAQDKLLPVFDFRRLTTADGLPTNQIRSNVVRDRQGFAWFSTSNGLVRYDGYECKVYPEFSYKREAIILDVDTKGRLWIGTFGAGLSLYDPTSDRFVNFTPRQHDSTSLQGLNINVISEDKSGILWLVGDRQPGIVWLDLGTARNETNADSVARHARFHSMYHEGFRDGVWYMQSWNDSCALAATVHGLFVCNRKTNAISSPGLPPVERLNLDTAFVTCLFWETPQKLWLGTLLHGLYLFDRGTGLLTAYHKRIAQAGQIRDDHIQGLQADRSGRLWVYCDSTLDLFDPPSGAYRDFLFSSSGPGRSSYTRLSCDSSGILWIPTADNGVYFLSPASFRFPRYALKGPSGRPKDMVTINRWSDGTYWVGTEASVARIRLESLDVLETVDLFSGEKSGLEHAGVRTSYDDSKGTLWYGTGGIGLYRFEPRTGRVKNFRCMTHLGGPFRTPDAALSITGVGRDSLWIAGCGDGILSFEPKSGTYSEVPQTRGGPAVHIMKDREGKIWISDEARGLFVFDPSLNEWQCYGYNPGDPLSIRNSDIKSTYQDPAGRIWVGSDTLRLWEPESRSFKWFPNPGFGEFSVAEPLGSDVQGKLWVRYDKGVAILDPDVGQFSNFVRSDGIVAPRMMSSLPDGRVILVGSGGINIVDPRSVFTSQPAPPLVLTKVLINDTANSPLQGISAERGLRLPFDENVLELGFAAIDPGATGHIYYLYRLEGFEEAWIRSNGRRFVRYPGLSPGSYVFKVRAVNRFGRWPDQEIALAVLITPPWWRTWWAYAGYTFIVLGLLGAGYLVRLRQVRLQQEVEMEHFQKEHLAEVDRLKSHFFANISHEFRTPLTLILGPVRKWRDATQQEDLRKDMGMVERNANRLLRLINQLLDLSKLEAGAMKLRACRTNIVPLIKGIAYSFESSADTRHIDLEVVTDQQEIEVYCDRDMIEKILTNLLSNAFKFTPAGRTVEIRVDLTPLTPPSLTLREGGRGGKIHLSLPDRERGRGGKVVQICVSDTGIGIPPDELGKVFDRFYQVDASQTRVHEGTGLGLALVKELVELHHGSIQVASEVGKGTTFTVRLPLGRSHLTDKEIVETTTPGEPVPKGEGHASLGVPVGAVTEGEEPHGSANEKPIVLVVEDNADVRAYIKGYLDSLYLVTEACDGVDGIRKATETVPDLIISDVMMPGMDGMHLCGTLKKDVRTSHVPVILLTAKADAASKIEGLDIGADDYVIKPFDARELLARVHNLIDQRRKLREEFSKRVELKPGEIAVTSLDDDFLKRAMAAVEKGMGNEDFAVENLAHAVFLSRMQLYRKLHALTNLTPTDFIKRIRLQRARELLLKNAGTVSEIAHSVGFSNHSYFSKCFHEQFGMTPSEVRNGSG